MFLRHYTHTKITKPHKLWFPSRGGIKNVSALPEYRFGAKCEKPGGRKYLSGPKLRTKSISKMTFQFGTSYNGPP